MRTITTVDGTVTLRERVDVTVRQRQQVEAAMTAAAPVLRKLVNDATKEIDPSLMTMAGLTPAEVESVQYLSNVSILSLLESWTYKLPLPTTLDGLLDLPADLYDELAKQVAADALEIVTETDFEPSDPKAEGFRATPTQPSVA